MPTEIKDLKVYTDGMFNSLKDKLFFLDQLKERYYTFFDFGCGDGRLLSTILKLRPESDIVGYDSSEEMRKMAINNNIPTYGNFDHFKYRLGWCVNSVLIFSSVIHEIYSYNTAENKTIDQFWELIESRNAKTIVVRDMMVSKSTERQSDIIAFKQNEYINSFKDVWGDIITQKQLIHFLLKYRYTVNWEREVRENYLPIYIEDFLKEMDESGYRLDYFCKYQLPFLSDCWKKDFNIVIPDTTHVKCIFTRK